MCSDKNVFYFQMEDSGVFYTSTMHPLYEEIPTPMSGVTTASHYAVSGEYQLLNSDYSTLPYSEATLPYSESIPFLQNNMISARATNHTQQQHHRNSQNNGGFYPKNNGTSKNTGKNGGKFSVQKTLPPIIKSGPFFGGSAKTCDITADDAMFPPPAYHDSQWRSRGGWTAVSSTANGGLMGRMQTLDPVRHLSSNISSTVGKKADGYNRSESPRYQIPHSKPPPHPKNGTAGNQNDFLPREAWTDFSGTNDWLHNAGLVAGETEQLLSVAGNGSNGGNNRQHYEFSKNTLDCPGAVRASLRAGKDLSGWADTPTRSSTSGWADTRSSSGGESRDTTASAESREISPTTLNSVESSDVTISTTSSSDSHHSISHSQPPYFTADHVKCFRPTAADPLSGDPT